MEKYSTDPILIVCKCEICPNNVTNFVLGLCARCVNLWTCKLRAETINLTVQHAKAGIVCSVQEKSTNTSEFGQVKEQLRQERLKKLCLFKMVHEKFHNSLLLDHFYGTDMFEVNGNYTEIDEIKDDLRQFRENFNLLNEENLLATTTSSYKDNNNNLLI